MLKLLTILGLLFCLNFLYAQQWTEPVNISNMEGTDYVPDITIGPDGTLHCVWSHKYTNQHMEIFYSKSTDKGTTWTDPYSISQNDTMACLSAHIVCDSQGKLYVTYDFNTFSASVVVMQTNDGSGWSSIDTVVFNYSQHNELYIDSEDRVYVFWNQGDIKIYYKYLENDILSEVFTPYPNNNYITKAVIDENNNIHGNGYYNSKKAYFKYDKYLDQWSDPVILSENPYQYADNSICVDSDNNPHMTWNESMSDTEDFEDATFYSYYNGSEWSTPELIAEHAYLQNITYHNGKPYIVDIIASTHEEGIVTMHYLNNDETWIDNTIPDTVGYNLAKVLVINNKFNALCYYYNGSQFDVFLLKTTFPLSIKQNQLNKSGFVLYQNYPNPFSNKTLIQYSISKAGYCSLNIYNYNGIKVKTLVDKTQNLGTYEISWNGTDDSGNKLPDGIYFYNLICNDFSKTKSLILINK